jgi:acetolactate synthase-1/2/3 large subunit
MPLHGADAEPADAHGDLQQRLYNAVRRATLDMYARGVAAEGDGRLLADLPPANFEKIVAAHDGHGERVERPADLPAALRRAADAVRGGQQALVNVICPP